jgi:hypothetical protein
VVARKGGEDEGFTSSCYVLIGSLLAQLLSVGKEVRLGTARRASLLVLDHITGSNPSYTVYI